LDDVVEVLTRRAAASAPADTDEADRVRPAGSAAAAEPADPEVGAEDEDGAVPGTVSPGQAAEVIAHLLGGCPVDEAGATATDDPPTAGEADDPAPRTGP